MVIDIKDYKPMGDGIHDDTLALQSAIDFCSESGGGRVLIAEGCKYRISGIFLRNNVELFLDKNAFLIGSGIKEKYIKREGPFERLNSKGSLSALIYAKGQENVRIAGEGTIDGSYELFSEVDKSNPEHRRVEEYPRPTTVYFENCTNAELEGIHIINVPFWTVHLVGCVNTIIQGITIENDLTMPNTDGIDIDRCKNTLISRCHIVTADDAICPKCTEETAKYGDMENLIVKDCHLMSISSAVKFGSSSFGNFRNCTFEDLTIVNSNRGLAMQIRDTHSVENIIFRNINIHTKRYADEWWGRGEPIYITICPREKNQVMGKISNVIFEDIVCKSENAIFIYGAYEDQITDIKFNRVSIHVIGCKTKETEFDLRPTCFQEIIHRPLESFVIINAEGEVAKVEVIEILSEDPMAKGER